jgi:hypothetical protein
MHRQEMTKEVIGTLSYEKTVSRSIMICQFVENISAAKYHVLSPFYNNVPSRLLQYPKPNFKDTINRGNESSLFLNYLYILDMPMCLY